MIHRQDKRPLSGFGIKARGFYKYEERISMDLGK
jgi:hypothetical protein